MALRGLSMYGKGRPKKRKKSKANEKKNELQRNINVSRKEVC
jgi:hypothetical protein